MKRLTSHEIALTFAEKFQSEYPNTPIYKLMEELRIAIDDHVQQVRSGDLSEVIEQSEQLKCNHQYMNAGTLQGEAMKKCLKCGNYVKAL